MENELLESANLSGGTEYRVRHGKVGFRTVDSGSAHEEDWTQVPAERLSRHVLCNTAVARWLERSLGWRRLLWACVGHEPNEMTGKVNHQVQVCH
jgi:predicted hydrolase (HD superfamily)